jgi:hypothetical protein
MKKILLLLLCTVLLVGTVSAFEFDNIKNYNEETRTVEIRNSVLGIPFLQLDKVAEIELKSELKVVVQRGEDREIGRIEVRANEDYANAFKTMESFDKRQRNKEVNRKYVFKSLSHKTITVDDYDFTPSRAPNGTTIYRNTLVGSHEEQEEVWTELTLSDFKKDEVVTIGIFTDVYARDKIEWIPNFFGVRINEWAEYTEGQFISSFDTSGECATTYGVTVFENDLYIACSGSQNINKYFAMNGTYTGTTFATANALDDLTTDGTNIWYSSNANDEVYKTNMTGFAVSSFDTGASGNTAPWGISQNGTFIWVWDNTANKVFQYEIDGTAVTDYSYDASASDNVYGGFVDTTGVNDEYFWNIDFGADSVAKYYNNGTWTGVEWPNENGNNASTGGTSNGTFVWLADQLNDIYMYSTFAVSPPNVPTLVVNSPEDFYNSTNNTFITNVTVFSIGEVGNTTLFIDNVFNQTNGTTVNNSHIIFTTFPAEKTSNWTYQACNEINSCINMTTRTFTIDATSPVLTVANLTNITTNALPVNQGWTYNATDPQIDSCYYNTTDVAGYVTVTCNSSITTSWATEGAKTVQYCANDTFGFETCNTSLLTVFFYTDYADVNPSTIGEGNFVAFTLYVNMTDTPHTIANLTFNNTLFIPTITTAQNYTLFQRSVLVPDGGGNSTGINLTANWSYNITGVINTTTNDVYTTVFSVDIDDCSSYGTTILNYTLLDEEDRTFMTAGQLIEYDINISSPSNSSQYWTFSASKPNVNSTQVCVPTGLLNNSFYTLDVTTLYEATSHVVEFNYIDNYNLSTTQQQNISLYTLNSSISTSFLIVYQDENYLPVQNAIIDLLRFYVGEGTYLSVENGKTDDNGQTVLHFVTEEVPYRALVYVNGELVYTSPDFLALCQETPCQINFQKQDDVSSIIDYETFGNLNYALTFNSTSRAVTLTYTTRDSSSSAIVLNVTRWDAYLNTSVCTETATSSGGTLVCNVPFTARNMTYYVKVTENGDFVTQSSFALSPDAFANFGYTGIILTGLLFLTLVLMAVPSGAIATLIFGVVGLVFASMLTLFSGGALIGVGSALMWLIIAIAIIIVKIVNRTKHS